VDILIKAFNKISKEVPDFSLKIVGYCTDKREFERLASGNNRIEFCDPVWYEGVIKLMTESCLFVLPSRTDASPRVLREAMASKKPVIASNIEGIRSLIKHGENGLLFESENVDDLAEKMKMVLQDEDYARRLAENGYKYVYDNLSEESYVNNFSNMIETALGDAKTAVRGG
jgi:glycosyltransferase involved in cell wall biosynthesis